jgi:lipopolysaccharide transport system ATP-binding protein
MSSDIAIRVTGLSKCYQIYRQPRDRLKQFVLPRLQRLFGQSQKIYYREFWALRSVSFEVRKGETVGIIGKNGCGKSTLLQLICGTLNPTAGTVETSGRIAALLELGSGFNTEFTGSENIFLNGALLGLTRAEVDARYDAIVAFADIGEFIDQPVKTYSSGMFVRLAFAIQANVDPEILIVDEALAVGDAFFVHKCMLRFHQLQEAGTTILLVTHDPTAIKTLCSTAIWLDHGQVAASGKPSLVVDQYLSALVGQPVVADFSASPEPAKQEAPAPKSQPPESGETAIPNIDRRLGDQSCVFVGVGLYNEQMQSVEILDNDSIAVIRMTIRNELLEPNTPLILGYTLRNHRGIDLASSNSEIERFAIEAPPKNQSRTIRMKIGLPLLHPGSYSLTLSLGYRIDVAKVQSTDGITNALVFEVTSKKLVHVLMSLNTEYQLEPGHD